MEKINVYTNDGSWRSLEFTFNKIDSVVYKPEEDWVVISASGRTMTFAGTAFYTQNDKLVHVPATIDMGTSWREYVNEAYRNNEKILMIFTKENAPLVAFHGKALSCNSISKNFSKFIIDEKDIYIYNLNYFVLSRN